MSVSSKGLSRSENTQVNRALRRRIVLLNTSLYNFVFFFILFCYVLAVVLRKRLSFISWVTCFGKISLTTGFRPDRRTRNTRFSMSRLLDTRVGRSTDRPIGVDSVRCVEEGCAIVAVSSGSLESQFRLSVYPAWSKFYTRVVSMAARETKASNSA